MSRIAYIPMPANGPMAHKLAALTMGETMELASHDFPDGETYLRFPADIAGRSLALVCTLANPNEKILPLIFAARAARELGAARIGLVAPYLAYMRQDKRFHPGEAVTSHTFAALISEAFDWLVTLDPHLHRYKSLSEIYSIPARAIHAAPALGQWIKSYVKNPFLIGPDEESEQWVSDVARISGARYVVLKKQRLGDRNVRIAPDGLSKIGAATPVLVDDIISSGKTVEEVMDLIKPFEHRPPVIVAIHGLFADGSDKMLERDGALLVTTNSVPHPSNLIDIAALLAPAVSELACAE